jgi:protein-S-isoprenylcysteine O-methyltransferase Ste14
MILPPTLFLLSIVAMAVLHLAAPLATLLTFPFSLVGLLPLVGGLSAAGWGSRRFKTAGTEIKTFGAPSRLVTDGLFRWTRNPMYLGFITALAGVWLLLGSASPALPLVVFAVLADSVYVPFEERTMATRFGGAYAEYCAHTRRWL